jgi:DNA polymerase III subunit gamma/tau
LETPPGPEGSNGTLLRIRRGYPGFSHLRPPIRHLPFSAGAIVSLKFEISHVAYQVIARKYRPQCFADVVGQEHVTTTLSNAIAQNRIAHAYLFCGPRGTGKTTIARIFAKCLNATDGPKAEIDENDPRAKEIAEGRSLDVLEIDGASNRGIDEIRELRETAKYAPASSRFKIYIIDEVHMLTKEAFNALLKTLEEPPAHVKFMFATTEPEKVLPTILSRCQRFDLRRIPEALIVKHLAEIAKKEGVQIEPAALQAIARGAEGGMRDAESALDQLISFCGEKIVESDVLSMFGLAAQGQIIAMSEAILNGDALGVLRELEELTKHGKDLARLLADLLNHFRNLLIYQVSGGDTNLVEVSEAEGAAIASQAKRINTESITRIMEVLTDAEGRLRDAASKKIFVEVALLRALEARNAVSIDAVLKHLHALRSGEPSTAAPPPAPAPHAPAKSRLEQAPAAPRIVQPEQTQATSSPSHPMGEGPGAGVVDLEPLWQKILEAVGRASAFTRSYLADAQPLSLGKGCLTIGFDPEFADQMELVNNTKTHAFLQTKLQELGYPNVQVKFIKSEQPIPRAKSRDTAPPAATSDSRDATPLAPAPTGGNAVSAASAKKERASEATIQDFKNDPLIQKALEMFKGQIVDVRM